jgi:hypothetical protein
MRMSYRTEFSALADNPAGAARLRSLLHCRDWLAEVDPDDLAAVDHEAPPDIADPLILTVEAGP